MRVYYTKTNVVFDQYSQLSLKEITCQRRAGGKTSSLRVEYKIDMKTPVEDLNTFLSHTNTKYQLALFLADAIMDHGNGEITTVTSRGVNTMIVTAR